MNRLNRHSALAVVPVYAALVLTFFAPYLLGLASFSAHDFTQLFLPFSMFQQDALLGLRLPVWDPYTNSGHPYLADPQAAVFYPVSNALLLLTGFARGAAARLYLLHVEAALHIFLACSFTYAFVRRLTGQRLAAFAAGLIFGFSGYLTGYPPLQFSILRTGVWLPLILLLLTPGKTGAPDWRRWLAAAAVHAIAFYAGHPQTFLFMTYTVGAWILMLGVVELARAGVKRRGLPPGVPGQGTGSGSLLRYAGRALLYVSSLLALSLAQLWPTWELTQYSVRAFVTSDYLTGGFEWEDSWQFLFPGVLTEFSPQYIGIIGLGLALAAVAALFSPALFVAIDRNLGRTPAFFFVICGVLAILLSYGAKGPLYGLFARFAPGGDLFRGQERAIYVAVFSLSVLAGYGLAVLPSLAGRLRRLLGWGLCGAVLAGTAVFLFFWLLPQRAGMAVSTFLLIGALALLFAAAFAFLCGAKRVTRTVLLLFLPLLVADLFIVNFSTNLSDGPGVRASLDRREAEATLDAAFELARDGPGPRPRVYNEFRLPDSSGLFIGWEDVWGSSPMRLFYYDSLFHDFPLHRLWELTGVGTVLTWREELPVASQMLEEFPAEGESNRIHRLEAVSPRWWWAQEALRNVADRDAPGLLADPDFDPKEVILVAESDADILGPNWNGDSLTLGSGGSASLRAEQVGTAHLQFEIESDQEGLLFVSENWLPGWKARWTEAAGQASSQELPIVRAHNAFLGIPLPAGAGTLDLRYHPESIRWGLAISGVAWVALLFALRGILWTHLVRIAQMYRQAALSCAAAVRTGAGGAGEEMASIYRTNAFQNDPKSRTGRRLESKQAQRAAALLLLVVAFAIRFFRLGIPELSVAEVNSSSMAPLIWYDIFEFTTDVLDLHLLGSFVIQGIWQYLTGDSEFAMRTIDAFAGTAAVALVYGLAGQLRLSRSTAFVSGLLLAVSAFAVWHSQDALANMISLSFTTSSTILVLRLISTGARGWALAGYVLCSASALYLNLNAVLILLAQNLFVVFLLARDFRFKHEGADSLLPRFSAGRWVSTQAAVGLLMLPWLALTWPQVLETGRSAYPYSLVGMLWRSLGALSLGESVPHTIWQFDAGILAAVVIVAGLLGAFLSRRPASGMASGSESRADNGNRSDRENAHVADPMAFANSLVVLLLLYLLVPLVGRWALGGSVRFLDGPTAIGALSPFVILVASGVTAIGDRVEQWLGWRWRFWCADPAADGPTALTKISLGRLAATGLICLFVAGNLFSLSNHFFDPSFSKSRGLRELGAKIELWGRGLAPEKVGSALVFNDPAIINYHPLTVGNASVAYPDSDYTVALASLRPLSDRGFKRVLLSMPADLKRDVKETALATLSKEFRLAATATSDHWALYLYTRPYPDLWQSLEVAFANGLTLVRVQVEPELPPAGGMLVVHLELSGDPGELTGGEKAFLHLVDGSGHLIAQWDPELRMDHSPHTISAAIEVPAEIPPGPLRLVGGLYDVTVEGAPRIVTESGEDSINLVSFAAPEQVE